MTCEQDRSLLLIQASFKSKITHFSIHQNSTCIKYGFICFASLCIMWNSLSLIVCSFSLFFFFIFSCVHACTKYVSVCMYASIYCGHTCVQVYIYLHEHHEGSKLMTDAAFVTLLPYSLRQSLSGKPRARSLAILHIPLALGIPCLHFQVVHVLFWHFCAL